MALPKFAVESTSLDGLHRITYKQFADERGSVKEFYRESDFVSAGLPSLGSRPQVNAPLTHRGGLRGIHAEFAHKLVSVAFGQIYAVIVDLRKDSDTAGQWEAFELQRGEGLFISSGLGNSFQSVSEDPSVYLYYFEKEWQPDMAGLACNPLDPELGIPWPVPYGDGMIISEKDLSNPSLREVLGA